MRCQTYSFEGIGVEISAYSPVSDYAYLESCGMGLSSKVHSLTSLGDLNRFSVPGMDDLLLGRSYFQSDSF